MWVRNVSQGLYPCYWRRRRRRRRNLCVTTTDNNVFESSNRHTQITKLITSASITNLWHDLLIVTFPFQSLEWYFGEAHLLFWATPGSTGYTAPPRLFISPRYPTEWRCVCRKRVFSVCLLLDRNCHFLRSWEPRRQVPSLMLNARPISPLGFSKLAALTAA